MEEELCVPSKLVMIVVTVTLKRCCVKTMTSLHACLYTLSEMNCVFHYGQLNQQCIPPSIHNSPGPREIPGCTGPCQLTYCSMCIFTSDPVVTPPGLDQCPVCYDLSQYLTDSTCFWRWARCAGRKYMQANVGVHIVVLIIIIVSSCVCEGVVIELTRTDPIA